MAARTLGRCYGYKREREKVEGSVCGGIERRVGFDEGIIPRARVPVDRQLFWNTGGDGRRGIKCQGCGSERNVYSVREDLVITLNNAL